MSVCRFSLHEKRGDDYPFAVETGRRQDVLHGYLLTWPTAKTFASKLKQMDHIEGACIYALLDIGCMCEDGCICDLGFNPRLPHKSLYRRSEITATGEGLQAPVQAYIYHQSFPKPMKNVIDYPNGDWMEVALAAGVCSVCSLPVAYSHLQNACCLFSSLACCCSQYRDSYARDGSKKPKKT